MPPEPDDPAPLRIARRFDEVHGLEGRSAVKRCNSGASGKNRVTARSNVAGAKKLRELFGARERLKSFFPINKLQSLENVSERSLCNHLLGYGAASAVLMAGYLWPYSELI